MGPTKGRFFPMLVLGTPFRHGMRDVQLWWRLHDEPGPELAQELEQLATLSLRERSPFLGLIKPLLAHADLRLRRAALACLTGARGMVGLRAIVAALDDDDASIRMTAVECLRDVAASEYVRWTHALFHPRPDVRTAALQGEAPKNTAHFGAYLRADPINRELAEAAPFPNPALALLFGLWHRNAITADQAVVLLSRATASHLRPWIVGGRQRPRGWVRDFLRVAAASTERPPIEGDDDLDSWVEIVARSSADTSTSESATKAVRTLADPLLSGALADTRQRLTVSVLRFGETHGFATISDGLLGLAVACEPRVLAMQGYPRALRRRAAKGLIEHRHRVVRPPLLMLRRLLRSDLVVAPDGSPDVLVATAIAGLMNSERLAAVIERFDLQTVARTVIADTAAWIAVCELPDEEDHLVSVLLDAVHAVDSAAGLRLTAIALGRFVACGHGALGRTLTAAAPIGPLLVEIVVQAQAGTMQSGTQVIERLGHTLTPRAFVGELSELFEGLVDRMRENPKAVAVAMFGAVASECDASDFALAISAMSEPAIAIAVAKLGRTILLPIAHETALADALSEVSHPGTEFWVAEVIGRPKPSAPLVPTSNVARALTAKESASISTCAQHELAGALRPALSQPSTGLVAALQLRTASHPDVLVCTALLGSQDEPAGVAALVDQWHGEGETFAKELAIEAVRCWETLSPAPPFAQVWLYAFEKHSFALLARVDAASRGLLAFLEDADRLPGSIARQQMWRAAASAITMRRYRDRARLLAGLRAHQHELIDHIVKQLDTDVGPAAAKLLVSLHLGGLDMAGVREKVLALAPDMDRETIHELARFTRFEGLPVRNAAARRRNREVAEQRLDEIRRERDLDVLTDRCRAGHPRVVQLAAVRLVELGSLGERRLASLLCEHPPVRCFAAIASTLDRWNDANSLDAVRTVTREITTPAQMQYWLATAFHGRGEPGWMVTILQALRVPCDPSWFARDEWDKLVGRYRGAPQTLAIALVDSPHPHVYRNAVELLFNEPPDDNVLGALRRFLEQGLPRETELRRRAAKRLNDCGDPIGLPLLMSALTMPTKEWETWLFRPPTAALSTALAQLLVASCLIGGPHACAESRLLALLEDLGVPADVTRELSMRLLSDARIVGTCNSIVKSHGRMTDRAYKTFEIADVFAWGVRRGRELTGRLFRVHMTWRRGDYGHTYLDSNSIHVTPLPMLKGDRDGRDVVEALILHEFGHHMYHRGTESNRVWQRATKEGLGHLLNLVADEHLERNLRALRPEYGDRLKRLASFAFQHNEREMALDGLLTMLGASAFDALSLRPLGVAYDARSITIQSGDFLRELERVGSPFARFVRALRQGLGNRHGDPIVEEALSLFQNRFRHSDMKQLYAITKRLQELFGLEAKMAEQFGGHETIKGTPREGAVHGEGVADDDVQREVERILDPRQLDKLRGGSDDGGPPNKLAVNVIDDDSFNKITTIERVAPDLEKHRAISLEVRRHADRVRRYFCEMGLNYVPQRARLRGRAFDRTRTKAVVTRRDPRMLVARELTTTTDLFIGVVIDCSGSMRSGGSMEKAHRFGVLLADAIRGLSNVEARFFGFTDRVIYDAGDERMCAVAALEAGGGNNDAGALYHAAAVAERSRRRSKLLVMISDGLPTDCSAVALRALAKKVTERQGIICAQVAVRPLSEICFPHYVEIKSADNLDVAVRRFGEIVSRLAKRALGR